MSAAINAQSISSTISLHRSFATSRFTMKSVCYVRHRYSIILMWYLIMKYKFIKIFASAYASFTTIVASRIAQSLNVLSSCIILTKGNFGSCLNRSKRRGWDLNPRGPARTKRLLRPSHSASLPPRQFLYFLYFFLYLIPYSGTGIQFLVRHLGCSRHHRPSKYQEESRSRSVV